MKIVTDGIVIREQMVRDADKIVDILTRDNGIVHAYAAGAKNIKNPKSTATGLLTYSQFVFYRGKEKYIVDEASAKEVFIGLRTDIDKLALAQYFCELAGAVVQEEERAEEQLRLFLNSIYILSKDVISAAQLKAIFELRLMALSGFTPDLIGCAECRCYEHKNMSFFPDDGVILCGDCAGAVPKSHITTGLGATAAMRHCIYSKFDDLFNFTIKNTPLDNFAKAAEQYTLAQTDKIFATLDFYKTISNTVKT
ncbi:MAG: DNA repair protein RecO [Clostridia bacterium]|nr:DNA repair protein RecO [Clostridia bacterium]